MTAIQDILKILEDRGIVVSKEIQNELLLKEETAIQKAYADGFNDGVNEISEILK